MGGESPLKHGGDEMQKSVTINGKRFRGKAAIKVAEIDGFDAHYRAFTGGWGGDCRMVATAEEADFVRVSAIDGREWDVEI